MTTLEQLGGRETLPALPYAGHEILVATSSEEPDISDVAATIAREPGLAARIVAIANHAFFKRQEAVYSLEQAILRIGLNRVRVLATSLLLNQVFDASACPAFQLERYWHDALTTGFCAARLAPHTASREEQEAAYLGGVLHSIGLLLLVHTFPHTMDRVLAEHEADPERPLAALTYAALGCEYGEAGELLLREWEVPEALAVIAGHAHRPGYHGEHAALVETVRFAHEWLQQGLDPQRPEGGPDLPEATLERIARACEAERESLAAFAQLLAEG